MASRQVEAGVLCGKVLDLEEVGFKKRKPETHEEKTMNLPARQMYVHLAKNIIHYSCHYYYYY